MTKRSDLKCRLCGKEMWQIGGYMQRVNEKGIKGIWECRPSCDADLPQDTKMLMAIEGGDKEVNHE